MKIFNFTIFFILIILAGCRSLTTNEKVFLTPIFDQSVNFSSVRLVKIGQKDGKYKRKILAELKENLIDEKNLDNRLKNIENLEKTTADALITRPGAIAIRNRLFFIGDNYSSDFTAREANGNLRIDKLSLLAHEMVHVWQHQNRSLTGYNLLLVASEHILFEDPYEFEDDLRKGTKYLNLRYEQQAEIMEEFVKLHFTGHQNSPFYRQLRNKLSEVFELDDFVRDLLAFERKLAS